jgi:hypothetical protein
MKFEKLITKNPKLNQNEGSFLSDLILVDFNSFVCKIKDKDIVKRFFKGNNKGEFSGKFSLRDRNI